jgi:glycosyltransferase involved in cell wall biosynthesis
MSKLMEQKACAEMRRNPRYVWRGGLPRNRILSLLSASKVCVISSRIEGGANVLSEVIVAGVPVIASRIEGNVGILGADYPGLFDVGGTQELMTLMLRAESDPKFLSRLQDHIRKLAPLFDPEREEEAWSRLLPEF